jgi:hypothetical protein
MNIWPFNRKQKAAEQEEARQKANLAISLAKYVRDDDESESTYTDVDFGEGRLRIPKITLESKYGDDPWAEASPADTTHWLKDENQAKKHR